MQAEASSFPDGVNGDGLIFENGDWIARPIDYSDLVNVPTPSPNNYNIDVTYSENTTSISVNPDNLVQSYVIKNETYTVENISAFPIDDLLDSQLERIDVIILKEFGVIEYRKGTETDSATIPGISGNELILVSILKTDGGVELSDLDNLFENGLIRSLSTGKTGLGGELIRNTIIDGQDKGFEINDLNYLRLLIEKI